MKQLIILLVLFGAILFLNKPEATTYTRSLEISKINGFPYNDTSYYFLFSIRNGKKYINPSIDTFNNVWYSIFLYEAEEPILYNYYLNHDLYRFSLIRSFEPPIFLTLHKQGRKVWLQIKKLNRAPEVFGNTEIILDTTAFPSLVETNRIYHPPKRNADIIINQKKIFAETQWNEFEKLLKKSKYWQMPPIK
jgi:hypothetical protein